MKALTTHISGILALTTLLASFAFAAQEEEKVVGSKPTTTPEYDNYWGDGDNPDMSAKALELINPEKVYLEEDGYIVAECEDQAFNDKWKLMKEPEGFSSSGYLKYVGKNLQGNHDGHNTDIYVQYQQNNGHQMIRVMSHHQRL